ncbi:MAG: DAK2 domain-containing protein [Anaerolineae bacterium]|nr:DAK2 domain-containing protein [Anaerolineae bacterium]
MIDDTKQSSATAAADGRMLRTLVQAGRDWLDQHHALVNQLNVFPVPDGDTGTNMLMTMRNALKEAGTYDGAHAGQVAAKIAHGAMMGSRGNSGTILSQIWQGFAHALRDHATFDTELLAHALREASDTAYRGVIKPVEGTILTVAREAAEEAEAAYPTHHDLAELMDRVVLRAKDALARTPDMLPILQKAGVVDSGGSGLVFILEGMARGLRGQPVEQFTTAPVVVEDLAAALAPEDEMGYGYDVQFIIAGRDLNVGVIRSAIDAMGWSTLVVGNEEAVKVHVHVHDPGIPLSYGIGLGALSDIVVENMQAQYQEYLRERASQPPAEAAAEEEPPAPAFDLEADDIGVVAVASGDGLARVFHQLGATELVLGGQTNNPSTQEILDAIQRVPTKKIVLLPNNKNIILAAEQAARLATDQDVVIVPTRTMPQGISALLPYDPQGDLAETARAMDQAKDEVVTGEITTATRSVELNGVEVSEGQIIGLVDGVLAVSGDSLEQVLRDVLAEMRADEHELVTFYYGNGIHRAEAEALVSALHESYDALEFEIVFGGQPHYHFILSAE